MNYSKQARSSKEHNGSIVIQQHNVVFGVNTNTIPTLPNPAEIFLGSLAACILKSVARFSFFMKFEYSHAEIQVDAVRKEKPPN